MRLKIGDEVWVAATTVRNSGTNNTNCYYIPVKARIHKIEEDRRGRFFFVSKKNKCKCYRPRYLSKKERKGWKGWEITTISNQQWGLPSNVVSRSWDKIKKITDKTNKYLRERKK